MEISFNVIVDVPDDLVSYAEAISVKSDDLIGEVIPFRSILRDSYIKAILGADLKKSVTACMSDVENQIHLEYDKRMYPDLI